MSLICERGHRNFPGEGRSVTWCSTGKLEGDRCGAKFTHGGTCENKMAEEPTAPGHWCGECGAGFPDLEGWLLHKYGSETPDYEAEARDCREPSNVTEKALVTAPRNGAQRKAKSRSRATARRVLRVREALGW